MKWTYPLLTPLGSMEHVWRLVSVRALATACGGELGSLVAGPPPTSASYILTTLILHVGLSMRRERVDRVM